MCLRTLLACVALTFSTACLHTSHANAASAHDESLWTVDLVRTLPGQQADYLRSIEANWAGARHLVRERGVVLSYRAFAALPNDERGWDVLLMTEYADEASWERREEVFREVFASPEFVAMTTSRPSSELREFLAAGVVLRPVVTASRR